MPRSSTGRRRFPAHLERLHLAQETRAVQLALQQVGQVGLQVVLDFLTHRRSDIRGGGGGEAAALEMPQHLERLQTQGPSAWMTAPAARAENASQGRAEVLRFRPDFRQTLDTAKELR